MTRAPGHFVVHHSIWMDAAVPWILYDPLYSLIAGGEVSGVSYLFFPFFLINPIV